MNESFQIIATLAAAQLVLGMAQAPRTAAIATARAERLVAAAFARWPLELMWASFGLATVVGLHAAASDEIFTALRLICGAHLLLLGVVAVRRSFADGSPARGETGRLGAVLTDPGTLPAYLSLFATTGTCTLADTAQVLAVLILPTLSFAWRALVALAVAPASPARARLRARTDRAALPLRLQPVPGRS